MSQLDWRHLNLSNNRLGSAAMKQLVRGRWPELKRLDLRKNQLDEAAIKCLSQGHWPALKELILDENPDVDAAVVACIPQAKFVLLSGLSLAKIDLDYVSMYCVALMHAQLESLCLHSTGVETAAVSVLFATESESWRRSQHLVLSNNRLTADAIARLVTTSLPRLHFLDLADNDLDADAACLLAQSRWPQLQNLHLQNNQFDVSQCGFLPRPTGLSYTA